MFSINEWSQSGFHMTFANGLTVSVQWGPSTYCDNREAPFEPRAPRKSTTAEVAVMTEDGWASGWPHQDGDDVAGWLTPKQVLEVLQWAEAQPKMGVPETPRIHL